MATQGRPGTCEPGGAPGGLQAYLAQIGTYPLLTAEEEFELGHLVQAGRAAAAALDEGTAHEGVDVLQARIAAGRRATERFVQSNLRLVVVIARHYRSDTLVLLDLVQEGNVGLIRAVERFDPTRGFRFSTYARYWIHQAVNKAVAEHGRAVRVPVQVMDLAWQVQRAQSALEARRGSSPSVADVADEVGLGPQRVAELMEYLRPPRSLSEMVGEDDREELADTFADAGAPTAHDELVARVTPDAVRVLLDCLDDREREIVRMHFGLDGAPGRTLAEIGERFLLTRERIRQIEARALKKLRNPANPGAKRALWLVAG